MKNLTLILLSIAALVSRADASLFNVLHSFGTPLGNIGFQPAGGVVAGPDGTLYGTAANGGLYNCGVVYNLTTNGYSFALWNFTGSSDGAFPVGDLALGGSTLYGITTSAGSGGHGTVFKVNTDGTGFGVLYSFTNGTDGGDPQGGLILNNGALYGVASSGGANGAGTVFKINTDGSGFQILHTFTAFDPIADTNADGADPEGKLLLSGNTLYGTAAGGGANKLGTIFSLPIGGGTFTTLHSLSISDGYSPNGGLILSGGKLFGTASGGGSSYQGTIFSLNTDGSDFTNLYSLGNGGNDGSDPAGDLLLYGNTLYGTANSDGANGNGTVFSLQTDGSNFSVVYTFSALDPTYYDNYDGANPEAGLILSGGILYGTASGGGFANSDVGYVQDFGTIFQINPTNNQFSPVYFFYNTSSAEDGADPQCPLLLSGNTLYGTAYLGGLYGSGSVFKMNTDGSGFTLLHSFDGTDGLEPLGGLALAGNTLYGTTSSGGADVNYGEIYAVNTDGTGFAVLHSFTNGMEGSMPFAGVVVSSNMLYGTTYGGGSNSLGTVFSLNLNGNVLKTLYTFAGPEGTSPEAPLVLGGNTLYGEAYAGGNGVGSLFRIQTDGSSFSNLRVFSFISGEGPAGEGQNPLGGLILSGTTLYGTTKDGGENHTGNIFRIGTNGMGYTTLFNCDPSVSNGYIQTNDTGINPEAGLCLYGNMLYGTMDQGGSQGYGTLFELNTNANGYTGYTNLHTFTAGAGFEATPDGSNPVGGVVFSGGVLFGVAGGGGAYALGIAYAYQLVPPLYITTVGNTPFVNWPFDGESHTLQTATNLFTGPWLNVPALNYTNLEGDIGLLITNHPAPPAAFFRLEQ